MPQKQRGGIVDGIRDQTRRDPNVMVDAGKTQIALWLPFGQTPVSGQIFLAKIWH